MAEANPTSVYLYFDCHGVLLYVGVTGRGVARQREHERTKPWWQYTHSQTIEHYQSRAAALEREAHLISVHCPPFNTQLNGDLGQRDVYLRYASGADHERADPKNKRIPLDVRVRADGFLIAVTDLRYAVLCAEIEAGGDFIVSAPGQRVRDVQIKRLGSALVVKADLPRPTGVTAGDLMYRINPYGKDVKRIDLR